MESNELKHYGVPGMKWGVRKDKYYKLDEQKKRILKAYALKSRHVVEDVKNRRYLTENKKIKTKYRKDYLAAGERVKVAAFDPMKSFDALLDKAAVEKIIGMKIDSLSAAQSAKGMRAADRALAEIGQKELNQIVASWSSRKKDYLFRKASKEEKKLDRYEKKDRREYGRIFK